MTRLEQALTIANTQDGFAQVWSMLGLPDEPKRIMHSPLRPDSKPSFSVYECKGKMVAHDFSSGESWDALDLAQQVLGVSKSDASRWLINAFCPERDKPIMLPVKAVSRPTTSKPDPLQPCKLESTIRSIHKPTENELERLCEVRKYPSIHGLRLMANRGKLVCGEVRGEPVWAVKDETCFNVHFRRFREGPWPKSEAVSGSKSEWIVCDTKPYDVLILCEGEADCLAAACLMAWDYIEHPDMWKTLCDKVGFGYYCNASVYNQQCLHSFKDKLVLICAQHEHEKPGLSMALNVGKQLGQHGARVRFWIPPVKGTDLNDYAEQFSEGDTLENSQAFARLPAFSNR